MSRPVYKVGDRVWCWVEDGVASGWDRGRVSMLDAHLVFVRTKTRGTRYYHQGRTDRIQLQSAVDALAEIGKHA